MLLKSSKYLVAEIMIDRKHLAFQRGYLWHFQHKMIKKKNLFGSLFASNSFDQDKELVLFLNK